jgi:hypothetical protein
LEDKRERDERKKMKTLNGFDKETINILGGKMDLLVLYGGIWREGAWKSYKL